MDMVNKAFIEIMIEGDANGRGFQYPIPTYSITKDFDWSETENNRLLFEMTAKYGTPYFSNYVNSDMQPSDVRSMCCRLRLDLRELRKKSGGFFGSGESTGSVGVVTINMPRIAYLSADKTEFYRRLDHMMDIAARSLKVKRTVITKLLDEGLYPYTKRYLGTFENHFSTIGLVGMNEAGLNAKWLREDLTSPRPGIHQGSPQPHARRLKDYQEQYGDLYNLEATPAESTAYRLAKHDVEQVPRHHHRGEDGGTPYYTNSSHLPVGYTDDIFTALDIQDELQTLYTSGTVFHAFLGEKLPDWKPPPTRAQDRGQLPPALLHDVPDVFHLQEPRLPCRRAVTCPSAAKRPRSTAASRATTARCRTGTTAKLQEFKDRQLYDLKKSVLKKPTSTVVKVSNLDSDTPQVETGVPQNIRYLFTTKTCPNCKMAKEFLREKNVSFITIDAEEDTELTNRYGIMQAPTLVIVNGDSSEKIVNASNIRKYAEDLTAVPAVPVR
jgi:glutaredoxin